MSPHLNRHQFVVFFSDSSINMAKSAPLDSNITLGTEQISVSIQWIQGGKGHGFENLLADQFAHPVSLFKTLPHLAWTNSHLGDFLQHFIIDSQPKVLIFYYLRNCLIIWFIIRIYLVEVISVGKGEALDRNWGKILRFGRNCQRCRIIREALYILKLFDGENEVWSKVDHQLSVKAKHSQYLGRLCLCQCFFMDGPTHLVTAFSSFFCLQSTPRSFFGIFHPLTLSRTQGWNLSKILLPPKLQRRGLVF